MDLVHVPVLKARLKTRTASLLPHRYARTLPQLRRAYPGLGPDELAKRLVADAARSSAAVGAAGASCALLPFPGAAPLAAAGESAAAGALRARLATELRTAYGLGGPSSMDEGSAEHFKRWIERSPDGLGSFAAVPGLALSALRAVPRQARRRLPKARTLLTATAVLTGLRAGRQTRRYAEALRRDLLADPEAWSEWPDEPGAAKHLG